MNLITTIKQIKMEITKYEERIKKLEERLSEVEECLLLFSEYLESIKTHFNHLV